MRNSVNITLLILALQLSACAGEKPVLKEAFKDCFYIGTAVNQSQVYGRPEKEAALISEQFSTITPENLLKWAPVHPRLGEYNFAPADTYVAFGEKNNMFIVGHTLVWHSQTPKWVFEDENGKPLTREKLLERMKEHIFAVAGRYKGRIGGWDVVNEAVEGDGSLRNSKWRQIIGDDFIEKAFEYAHQAAPDAELYYNDYDMWKKQHKEGVIKLVKGLKGKGLRVDGIGMQGHWGLDYPSLEEIEQSIIRYSELGVKVMITELDITVLPSPWGHTGADISQNQELRKELNPYPDGLPDEVQKQLTKRYRDIFAIFTKHADKISRVTLWGAQDGNSWRNGWPVRERTDYPLLFDRNCEPKPAVYEIVKTTSERE
jgi:endo-1,4-beta-xylanase